MRLATKRKRRHEWRRIRIKTKNGIKAFCSNRGKKDSDRTPLYAVIRYFILKIEYRYATMADVNNVENIDIYLEEKIRDILPSSNDTFARMTEDLLSARGKHLRPKLCVGFAGFFGRRDRTVLDMAVVLELLHQASLLQDDVFDDETERRGRLAFHAKWSKSKSILLSDIILANGVSLLLEIGRKDISKLLLGTISEMCQGEIIHSDFTDKNVTEDDYISIVRKKTASLFASSCVSGAMLASDDKDVLEMVSHFGMDYGTAYQLIDDCIDMDGTDLINGTRTLPHIYAKESICGKASVERTLALARDYLDKADDALTKIKAKNLLGRSDEIDDIMERTRGLIAERMVSGAGVYEIRSTMNDRR